ncbi:MAG: M17 family peptidase N-terminal domain-containing protein [Archangium sp.]|nr:M17 family peptidase N-terminal domain-containing protein [Archangium sp.]MDP3156411.1 M17 family peptidase N-terminal domain-containing protein [Archangium sp.]MDP3573143.1 M17 family peptidase N-terminal domain-containing protein [Archangium sp.]
MKPQQLTSGLDALDAMTGIEAVCCFVVEDERPLSGAAGFLDWRLCGALSKILGSGFFVGAPGDKLLVPTDARVPARKLFAVGLGRSNAVTALGLEHALTQAAAMLSKANVDSVALAFPALPRPVAQSRDELVDRAFAPHFSGAVAVFSP